MKKSQTSFERDKILEFSSIKFLSEGFYKTSMDALSGELHMSKKTIYKHFPTKESLVEEVAQYIISRVSLNVDNIISSETNVIKKITDLIELLGFTITKFSEKWLSDLKVHLPAVWEKIDNFRAKKIYSVFSKIIEEGKEEKIFIDLPNEIVITMFVASLRAIVNPEFIYHNKFSYKEAIEIALEILFNGILTEKGKKLLKKSMSKSK